MLMLGKGLCWFCPRQGCLPRCNRSNGSLQFMQAGKSKVAVPTTVHCDHLIQAKVGAEQDLKTALSTSNEVFHFLESVSNKYGIGFLWKPGAGIIHHSSGKLCISGGMMIGTDSYTVNAGGLGMVAIGVGGPMPLMLWEWHELNSQNWLVYV